MSNRIVASLCLTLVACGPRPVTGPTPDPVTHPDVVSNVAGEGRELNPAPSQLVVTPMRGPFESIAAFCDTTEDRTCSPIGAVRDPDRPVSAPFTGAVYLAVGVEGMRDCYLGVEVNGSWYIRDQAESCAYQDTRSMMEVVASSIHGGALLSGGSQVVLEYAAEETYSNMDNDGRHLEDRYTAIVVCGVGTSGAPSCTESLVIQRSWQETALDEAPGDHVVDQGSWSLTVDYAGDVITVSGDDERAADRVGDHTIVFP